MNPLRIGIDLGGTKIEGVVMDAAGQLVQRLRVPSPSDSYPAIIVSIAALVDELERRAGAQSALVVGIGTPGAWVAEQAAMKNCNSTVLNGQPLLQDLERALGERVRLANDANCFSLSEAIDGAAAGAATVFGVILGTGVGGGLVVDGKLLTGVNANAGEWGHTPLSYLRHAARVAVKDDATASRRTARLADAREQLADRHCYCGRVNCVETFLSGPGLASTALEILDVGLTAEAVFAHPAESGDERILLVQELYCDLLARSLAQVLNVIDPDAVVLGGGLSAQPLIYERLQVLLPRYLFDSEATNPLRTRILPPVHGDSSGVRGAAWLWPAEAN